MEIIQSIGEPDARIKAFAEGARAVVELKGSDTVSMFLAAGATHAGVIDDHGIRARALAELAETALQVAE